MDKIKLLETVETIIFKKPYIQKHKNIYWK